MTALRAARSHPALVAELALALLAGSASFAIVAIAVTAAEPPLLVAVIGAGCVAAVLAIDRACGIAYAVPVAVAALVAVDWYQLPPIHAGGSRTWALSSTCSSTSQRPS